MQRAWLNPREMRLTIEQGPDMVDPKNNDKAIMATEPNEDFYSVT